MNIPTNCPSCDTLLIHEGVHLVCKNKRCPEQQILKIVHWVVNAGMDGIAESTIRTLYDSEIINSIRDLYDLTPKDLEGIEGIGERKIQNLLNQIEITKEMSIESFCDKLGIPLVGEKAIRKLNVRNIEDLLEFKGGEYVIAQNLKAFVDENRDMIVDLLSCVKIKKSGGIKMKVAVTGAVSMKRTEFEALLGEHGIELAGIVKGTEYLICNETSESSKTKKAISLGIPIVSEEEFYEIAGIER
jgi:DNA ligase (NAD+)